MKSLVIQIQPARAPQLGVEGAISLLAAIDEGVSIARGSDSGPFVNLTYTTDNVDELWMTLAQALDSIPPLAAASIVTCEGEQGWSDYLLLHHFDADVALDYLSEGC